MESGRRAQLNRPENPAQAWQAMLQGNSRFVTGDPAHPRQDADHRASVVGDQKPFAALFGCADSRLSAEIIFDVGLGDLFVVRNAGQVIAETIIGSLEYAVEVLQVPLILVLGHDKCGAIRATIDSTQGNLKAEGSFIHNLVSRITETVEQAQAHGINDIDEITVLHVQDTINELVGRSDLIRKRIESGKLAVVGAKYALDQGMVSPVHVVGQID